MGTRRLYIRHADEESLARKESSGEEKASRKRNLQGLVRRRFGRINQRATVQAEGAAKAVKVRVWIRGQRLAKWRFAGHIQEGGNMKDEV